MAVAPPARPPYRPGMATRTRKKKWSDLSPVQQRLVVLGGAAELVLTGRAVADLVRRPPGEVRGPKTLWAATLVVQPFGPLAYLTIGRR